MKVQNNSFSVIAWFSGGAALFLFLAAAYVFLNKPETAFVEALARPRRDDVVMWNKSAPHTLVVFSDFQCPACQTFHETLEPLASTASAQHKLTQKVSYVFKYFPLYQIHEHAFTLSYAAQAAQLQGKFEQMSNYIFSRQKELENADIEKLITQAAQSIGLDKQKFELDRRSETVKRKIDQDLSDGEKAGVDATPTFFLDGKKLDPMSPQDLLRKLEGLK